MQFMGKLVKICTSHKIYGDQQYKAHVFQPFHTEDSIGFLIGTHKIYLFLHEIESMNFEKDVLHINGTLQNIAVKIIS